MVHLTKAKISGLLRKIQEHHRKFVKFLQDQIVQKDSAFHTILNTANNVTKAAVGATEFMNDPEVRAAAKYAHRKVGEHHAELKRNIHKIKKGIKGAVDYTKKDVLKKHYTKSIKAVERLDKKITKKVNSQLSRVERELHRSNDPRDHIRITKAINKIDNRIDKLKRIDNRIERQIVSKYNKSMQQIEKMHRVH